MEHNCQHIKLSFYINLPIKTVALLILFTSFFNILHAQNSNSSQVQAPANITISTDQDFLFVTPHAKNEDRNYTQGTSFSINHQNLPLSITHSPMLRVTQLMHCIFKKEYNPITGNINIVGTAFTPLVIDSTNPIVGDRPFAFLLGIGTNSVFESDPIWGMTKNKKAYHTLGIVYGLLGTHIGYKFQSYAHSHLVIGRPKDPIGWNTQIADGGKFTGLIHYNRLQTIWDIKPKNSSDSKCRIFDISLQFGGSYGYYDRIYGGLTARIGRLKENSQFIWNGSNSSIGNASYAREKVDSSNSLDCKLDNTTKGFINSIVKGEQFVYASISTTAMFRNSLLEGPKFGTDPAYVMPHNWTTTGIYEFEFGFVLNWKIKSKRNFPGYSYPISLTFKQVTRSPEFNSKIFQTRFQYFGGASLTLPLQWLFNQ